MAHLELSITGIENSFSGSEKDQDKDQDKDKDNDNDTWSTSTGRCEDCCSPSSHSYVVACIVDCHCWSIPHPVFLHTLCSTATSRDPQQVKANHRKIRPRVSNQ